MHIENTVIKTSDYKGRTYTEFFAERDCIRKGWFVWGKGAEYGGTLRMICAWPEQTRKPYATLKGWRLKREAQAIADKMNAASTNSAGGQMSIYCEHPEVIEETGDPSLGPYYICDRCGAAFGSLAHLNVRRYEAQILNRKAKGKE